METGLQVPWLEYDEIRKKADDFLRVYHPSSELPIPIEEIVEFRLNLDIVPIPGLHAFIETDGFLYGDLSAIAVDDFVYNNRPARCRFTLAHEVGHFVLHPQIFKSARAKNLSSWKKFVNSLPERVYSRAEYQAYSFAGLILVPSEHLKSELNKELRGVYAAIKGEMGVDSNKVSSDFIQSVVEDRLAKTFDVSADVIHRRIEHDDLTGLFHKEPD